MKRGYAAIFRRVTVDEVIDHVAFEFGLEPAQIVGSGERAYPREARRAVAWLVHRHTTASATDLCLVLNRSYHQTLMLRRRAVQQHATDPDFRVVVERIDGMLSSLGELRAPRFSAVSRARVGVDPAEDVARLVRAVHALMAVVPVPFIAERQELEAALREFPFGPTLRLAA